MKTLLSILFVSLMGISVYAVPEGKTDYVVTKDGKMVVAKVKFGLLKMHAKQSDGTLLKVDYKDVASFKKNGETYEKKPLYNGRKNTGNIVFMKLISWRNGFGLYCYEDPRLSISDSKRYFVYKGENTLWLEVESRNVETLRKFFGRI